MPLPGGGRILRRGGDGRPAGSDVQTLMRIGWTIPVAEYLTALRNICNGTIRTSAKQTVRTIYQACGRAF